MILFHARSDSPFPEVVSQKCGFCHAIPPPDALQRKDWPDAIRRMEPFIKKADYSISEVEIAAITEYYLTHSPESLPLLPIVKPDLAGPVSFVPSALGKDTPAHPQISHVTAIDLDGDGLQDLLVCDTALDQVIWVKKTPSGIYQQVLAEIPAPAHATPVDLDQDGDLDILVSSLGQIYPPTEEKLGAVYLLRNVKEMRFQREVLYKDIYRVADVQTGDLDGDGDMDLVLALFGGWVNGGIAWLELTPDGYVMHELDNRAGPIHTPLVDLDSDGDLDIVALISQSTEMIVAFINSGKGQFSMKTLFDAENPNYGSSGIEIVDLDQDGDDDILYVNGDAFDVEDPTPKPYHGIQWLENKGALNFTYHRIANFYGVYGITIADLDQDGDMDIAASSFFNFWGEPDRNSLIWLENDGLQNFTRFPIANSPTHLVTITSLDFDNDGDIDLVTGGMHVVPPFDRIGRITLWSNELFSLIQD